MVRDKAAEASTGRGWRQDFGAVLKLPLYQKIVAGHCRTSCMGVTHQSFPGDKPLQRQCGTQRQSGICLKNYRLNVRKARTRSVAAGLNAMRNWNQPGLEKGRGMARSTAGFLMGMVVSPTEKENTKFSWSWQVVREELVKCYMLKTTALTRF